MLTPFGREVRKLRIDHEPPMRLKDLANLVDVSSAYLSCIETGTKAASPSLVDKVADALGVDPNKRRELHRLASESTKTVQLDLSEQPTRHKDLAMTFARRFASLNESQVDDLLKIIERDEHATQSKRAPKKGRA